MIFDLFHSVSDPVISGSARGALKAFHDFFSQARLADALGMKAIWLAESHFSSEIQKRTSVATIPNFRGEVGLNCDSFQWIHELVKQTKRIEIGTAIHNIVGGSGGPIASSDRVNTLQFINHHYWGRHLHIGIASGRFPYQNTPFGFVPRDEIEKAVWPFLKRVIFLEALEIFLRLLKGEVLASSNVSTYTFTKEYLPQLGDSAAFVERKYPLPINLRPRWEFESLKLVPEVDNWDGLSIVLGSHDPWALDLAYQYWGVDLFNLSFTPPEQLEKLHLKLSDLGRKRGTRWQRARLPRTVLVFIDPDPKRAIDRAHFVLDTYIEAMRGTAQVPEKETLLSRALIGDAKQVRDQLTPGSPHGFNMGDRLMLWFEFNQSDSESIQAQMKYFMEQVAPHFA